MGTLFVNMNMNFNLEPSCQTLEFLPSETRYANGGFAPNVNDTVLFVYCFGADQAGPYGPGPIETLGPGSGDWEGPEMVTEDVWVVTFDWNIIMGEDQKKSLPLSLALTDWKKLSPGELEGFQAALRKLLESNELSKKEISRLQGISEDIKAGN